MSPRLARRTALRVNSGWPRAAVDANMREDGLNSGATGAVSLGSRAHLDMPSAEDQPGRLVGCLPCVGQMFEMGAFRPIRIPQIGGEELVHRNCAKLVHRHCANCAPSATNCVPRAILGLVGVFSGQVEGRCLIRIGR
jgi:hypothetical protein